MRFETVRGGCRHTAAWPGACALTVLAAVLLWTLGVVRCASAASVTFTPAFAEETLEEGATFSAAFTFTGGEYHGTVAPLTSVTVHLPGGVGGTQAGFSTCTRATLEVSGIEGCPPDSIAGPPGSITIAYEFGEQFTGIGSIQAVFAGEGQLLFYILLEEPISFDLIASATYSEDAPPYSRRLTFEMPRVEVLPQTPLASVTALTLELGVSRQEGLGSVDSLILPEQCPPGGLGWAADVSFLEGPPDHSTAQSACEDLQAPEPLTGITRAAGPGGQTNVLPALGGSNVAGKTSTKLTRAQSLAKALKRCAAKRPKSRRRRCRARARKRYRPKKRKIERKS